jgi:signal transduction histidine kinase
MVNELIHLHGGNISASSMTPGTSFAVQIPKGYEHLPAANIVHDKKPFQPRHASTFVNEVMAWVDNSENTEEPTATEWRNQHILIADDNADMRDYLKRLLSRLYRLTLVRNGEEALQALKKNDIDLVIADVMMPEVDGHELLQRIRQLEQLSSLPVLLLSARAGEEAKAEGIEAGADDYLVKPFNARELHARLERLLHQRQIAEALDRLVQERTLKLDQLANDLARSNKELEQFAYVASHDLQEPLRTVLSFCDLLAKKNRGSLDADSAKYLEIILESSARMQQLIKDLLLYARLESEGNALRQVDLGICLNQAIKALDVAILEAGARITYDEMPSVMGDATQLSLLFQNLIANGIKFRRDEPPQIHIGVSKKDEWWQISCTDNGIGMKMEYAERIFVIFQRLHSRSKFDGTGIGLAVCKRIVERHGGNIAVHSSPGNGSTFTFTLKG